MKQTTLWNFIHPDAKQRSDESGLDADYFGPSMTNQADAPSADINNIMNKYIQTGLLDHVSKYQGSYGDFVDAPTYHEAMNAVLAANDMFDSIPAQIRAKFNNDPAQFLEFVQDPSNSDALVEMGLATPVAGSPPVGSPPAPQALAGGDPAPGADTPSRKSSKSASTEA